MPFSTSARLYGMLLTLFPAEFRTDFGYELMCDFSESTERARRRGGAFAVARLWAGYGEDFVRALIVQWLRTGIPTIVGISVSSTALLILLVFMQSIPSTHPLFGLLHLGWFCCASILILLTVVLARFHRYA